MIVPSIDLMNGQAVQLIGGKEKALDAGDPQPLAEKFALVGELAVIDLDAALGTGSNAAAIHALLTRARCRVGGGIRTVDAARTWLDAGAAQVILGTAATPEILRELPRERTIAALDARHGEVVVKGWTEGTGEAILSRMKRLRGLVGGFLITFVEQEGRLGGTHLDLVPDLVQAAAGARVTIAGGVTTAADVAALDAMGADAQVGMALYTGRLALADAFAAPLSSDRSDGLWPTVVTDESGIALGLAYSSQESLRRAIDERRGIYHSRKRGIWVKGETSGDTQDLLQVDVDCDRDALRFIVRQRGKGFCHMGTDSCWGSLRGFPALESRITRAALIPDSASYTKRLLADPTLLRAKLIEEAGELASAQTPEEVTHETADVIYFSMVAMHRGGSSLSRVQAELDRRALKLNRRPGNAKPAGDAT